ncbi:MAG: sulfotransferase domain-containing protein [Flavobacteriaceae bacterium]
MIWLASFPRSGNTFFRNILFDVYGISSSEYHMETNKKVVENFTSFPVVKTHLLPSRLPKVLQSIPSVYIIRDGRDALVSIAHHRRDIIAPGSNYYKNLLEAILARGGSFFGGWSENVAQWTNKATIVIRYEDLIKDPIGQVERLREIIELPEPKVDKVPTFKSLKGGTPQYGSGGKKIKSDKQKKDRSSKFFRRGVVGSYKDEMPVLFQILFWVKNKKQMKANKYYK